MITNTIQDLEWSLFGPALRDGPRAKNSYSPSSCPALVHWGSRGVPMIEHKWVPALRLLVFDRQHKSFGKLLVKERDDPLFPGTIQSQETMTELVEDHQEVNVGGRVHIVQLI